MRERYQYRTCSHKMNEMVSPFKIFLLTMITKGGLNVDYCNAIWSCRPRNQREAASRPEPTVGGMVLSIRCAPRASNG